MANVLVRDVPEEVHGELLRRAQRRGQSLQAYLSGELTRLAERPALEDILDRIGERRSGRVGLRRAAKDVADERDRR